jgi:preprotein translocase subunit YajC
MMGSLAATAAVLLAATKKSSSSSSAFLLIIIVIVFAGYFLFLRPQQQKARAARAKGSQVEVGDEILTVGGIVGRVVEVTDDRITIVTGEDSHGFAALGSEPTRLVLVKQAIARKIEPEVQPEGFGAPEDAHHDELEHDEPHHDGPYHDEPHADGGPGKEDHATDGAGDTDLAPGDEGGASGEERKT